MPRKRNAGDWSPYRDLGRPGEPYPAWVQHTKGRSGVYAIRHGNTLVYVGESHSDRLYETMTRHFQKWNADERVHTYPRSSSTVSVLYTAPSAAPTMQRHTIIEREPRDNIYETEDDEGGSSDTPF